MHTLRSINAKQMLFYRSPSLNNIELDNFLSDFEKSFK